MRLFNNKICLSVLVFSAALLPYSVFASSVYLETAHTEFFVGDTILIDVKVDSNGKEINTVEGKIFLDYLPGAILIRDINLSESSFSLWPDKPLLSDDLRIISFAGGVPSGFKKQDAILFKIALNLTNTGQITLSPDNVSVYLNDGKGTRDTVGIRNLTINVLPQDTGNRPANDLDALILEDKTPPEPFIIIAGQDDSVFEGKKFLSFSTVDNQSGVRYYEVIEGSFPVTRSGGTFVLQNQHTSNEVIVIAYDAAGNSRESVYSPPLNIFSYPIIISLIGSILIIILSIVIFRKIKRSRK